MKNFLIGFMAIVISSFAFASGDNFVQPKVSNYFGGFYLGLSAGVTHAKVEVDNSINDSLQNIAFPLMKVDAADGDTTINGAALFGYGRVFALGGSARSFYLGGELAPQVTRIQTSAESKSDGMPIANSPVNSISLSTVEIFSFSKLNFGRFRTS